MATLMSPQSEASFHTKLFFPLPLAYKYLRSITIPPTFPIMAYTYSLVFPLLPVLFLFSVAISSGDDSSSLHTYIVHVRRPDDNLFSSDDADSLRNYYRSFLPPTDFDSSSSPRLLYSYSEAISGFAARLTEEEASAMTSKAGFLSANRSPYYHLMTTRTPAFLGLRPKAGLWRQSNGGEGVIIGMLDTGIDSTHPSFSDAGISTPPTGWKSICQLPASARCNNKLISARAFGNMVAYDTQGHGTHTSSTAGGNFVDGADVLGQANGTASGIAPRAHLSVYKVCTSQGCSGEDLTAGLDAVIQDGVDVASLSLGGPSSPYDSDPIAIAGFRAFEKGVTFVCAAGNLGPSYGSLSNEAPWLITVGSSSLDRMLEAIVQLGDGQEFAGEALFQPRNFSSKQYPLVAPSSCDDLSPGEVKGKIVLCELTPDVGASVQAAGGVAVIVRNSGVEGATTMVDLQPIPSSLVTFKDGEQIAAYAGNSTPSPTAAILFCGTVIGSRPPAPVVSFFSSRGPSFTSAGILKPDIIAPGLNVLAAWPPVTNSGIITSEKHFGSFNIISGTSMSTPHITGVVALLKNAHPNWSPAAIKSAIMTTADVVDNRGKPIMDETLKPADYFALGAGHVNPEKASDPGLVYNITGNDFIQYLCGLGYSDKKILIISGREVSCARTGKITEAELNYPSILVVWKATSLKVTVNRTATNVGEAASLYIVEVESPSRGLKVTVKPTELKFKEVWEEKKFSVTIEEIGGGIFVPGSSSEGSLKWVSAKHTVRSPIVVMH